MFVKQLSMMLAVSSLVLATQAQDLFLPKRSLAQPATSAACRGNVLTRKAGITQDADGFYNVKVPFTVGATDVTLIPEWSSIWSSSKQGCEPDLCTI